MVEPSKDNIIIIGAGGHGSELYSYLRDLIALGQPISVAGFVDEHKPRGSWGNTEIIGNFQNLKELLEQHPEARFQYITAVGNNQIRKQMVQQVENLGVINLKPFTLLHPQALVGHEIEVGEGTCLTPGSIITTRTHIGSHSILNVNASVSHDCTVGDFVNINPRTAICGNVKIGEGCYIGAGATIIDKVSIGEWTVIGAGAVVINDIPPYCTAVGVPARVIKQHQK
jgi:sugar O-acyltransferase (sialic acid O-acetyltransferase NeuD family)